MRWPFAPGKSRVLLEVVVVVLLLAFVFREPIPTTVRGRLAKDELRCSSDDGILLRDGTMASSSLSFGLSWFCHHRRRRRSRHRVQTCRAHCRQHCHRPRLIYKHTEEEAKWSVQYSILPCRSFILVDFVRSFGECDAELMYDGFQTTPNA